MGNFRLKLLYGQQSAESMRRLYPQLSTRMLLRHGDRLLVHATMDYEQVIKRIAQAIKKHRQDFEEQHVKKYLREYPQIAQTDAILGFIKREQTEQQALLLEYSSDHTSNSKNNSQDVECLIRALGMRPFLERSFRMNNHIRQNIRSMIAALPYKAFVRSYRRYLERVLHLIKSCLEDRHLDDLHNYQWYFETFVALLENALLYCLTSSNSSNNRDEEAELACQAVVYYIRAMRKYNANAQICDRLFLASINFCNH